MRLRRVRPQRRPANFNEDDRLATFGRQFRDFHKLARVFKALDKTGNHPRGVVIDQIAGKIGKIEIGFITRRHDITKADTAINRPHQKRPERRGAALTDHTDRTAESLGHTRRRTGPNIIFDIRQAQTVGTAQPDTGFLGKLTKLALQIRPVGLTAFRKPGRNDHGRARPFIPAFFQYV